MIFLFKDKNTSNKRDSGIALQHL